MHHVEGGGLGISMATVTTRILSNLDKIVEVRKMLDIDAAEYCEGG